MEKLKGHINKDNHNTINKMIHVPAKRPLHSYRSIIVKLIVSFLIPVVFVIALGAVSYYKASKSITTNYKDASLQSLKMTCEYLDLGLTSVQAKGVQYITNSDIDKYVIGVSNNTDKAQLTNSINEKMLSEQVSDNFIKNIHILAKNADTMTTANLSENNLYDSFLKDAGGKKLSVNSGAKYWIGSDRILDKGCGISNGSYVFRYVCGFPSYKACVIFDISSKAVEDTLEKLNFGRKSIIGFVTGDDRELITSSGKNKFKQVFGKENFFKEAANSKKSYISKDVNYKGNSYLFLYSKINDSDAKLCALIPKANMLSQVNGIKYVTLIMVLLSCIIAVVIGYKISSGIQHVIRYIIAELDHVSQGNLAIELKVKNKDEFSILVAGINRMIVNMRGLIEKVKQQSGNVTISSDKITSSSQVFSNATKGISSSMNEIQTGITQQAQDAENCLIQMDKLSDKIQVISGKTEEINKIAMVTKDSVFTGINSMDALNEKTSETTNITQNVIKNIEALDEKSRSISKIVEMINVIAGQTNLLSLNASIEAARAGEAGRGFTVVAEEIRTLANQSVDAVNQIEGLIKEVQMQIKNTVQIANKADCVVMDQQSAVDNTEKSLHSLNENVEKLISNVDMITESIDNIDQARTGTLLAIENISAVSQQTAAETVTVNESVKKQMDEVLFLEDLSKELNENAQALNNEIKSFILEQQ